MLIGICGQAARLMLSHKVGRLPVMEKLTNGGGELVEELVGIVSRTDVVMALTSQGNESLESI